jgi:hypothetical protein
MDSSLLEALFVVDDDEISILKSLENAMEREDSSMHCSVCSKVRFRLTEVQRSPLRATVANPAIMKYKMNLYSSDRSI